MCDRDWLRCTRIRTQTQKIKSSTNWANSSQLSPGAGPPEWIHILDRCQYAFLIPPPPSLCSYMGGKRPPNGRKEVPNAGTPTKHSQEILESLPPQGSVIPCPGNHRKSTIPWQRHTGWLALRPRGFYWLTKITREEFFPTPKRPNYSSKKWSLSLRSGVVWTSENGG